MVFSGCTDYYYNCNIYHDLIKKGRSFDIFFTQFTQSMFNLDMDTAICIAGFHELLVLFRMLDSSDLETWVPIWQGIWSLLDIKLLFMICKFLTVLTYSVMIWVTEFIDFFFNWLLLISQSNVVFYKHWIYLSEMKIPWRNSQTMESPQNSLHMKYQSRVTS